MNRRSLILGIGATLAAPAIVRAESLMKIAAVRQTVPMTAVEIVLRQAKTSIITDLMFPPLVVDQAGRFSKGLSLQLLDHKMETLKFINAALAEMGVPT